VSYLVTLAEIENPKAWLIAAVCNGSRHYWRSRSPLFASEDLDGETFARDPAAELTKIEHDILVSRMLSLLPPRQREVLRLHYFEQMTAPEMAARLGTTTRYAERLIWKSLKSARRIYERLQNPK
jgi:RNA polymerase sigma factor (sigma-70 family)